MVSHAPPRTRLGYLERPGLDWTVAVLPVPKPPISRRPPRADDVYYVYVCRKFDRWAKKDDRELF